MTSAASVSGRYIVHPEARCSGVGRGDGHQAARYARRCGMEQDEAERWLGPTLGHDPDSATA